MSWLGRSAPRLYLPPRSGSRVEQDQGATRAHCGQVKSLPELPTSVRPPDHARPQTGQATGQTRSADMRHQGSAESVRSLPRQPIIA